MADARPVLAVSGVGFSELQRVDPLPDVDDKCMQSKAHETDQVTEKLDYLNLMPLDKLTY